MNIVNFYLVCILVQSTHNRKYYTEQSAEIVEFPKHTDWSMYAAKLSLISIFLKIVLLIFHIHSIESGQSGKCELDDDDYEVVVLCKHVNASNVGPDTDEILIPILPYEDHVHLELTAIIFPNGIVQKHWYTGSVPIKSFHFKITGVTVIGENAFNCPAFYSLGLLALELRTFTEFKSGIFNGLDNLQSLAIFQGEYLTTLGVQLLKPLHRKLRFFNDSSLNSTLKDLFGGSKMSRLTNITLRNAENVPYRRILSGTDFTGLPVVSSLVMHQIGIEAILDDTFSVIGETLSELDLSLNFIKYLNIDMFYNYFNTHRRIAKSLYIGGNAFECDCNFYLLKNVSIINFGYADHWTMDIQCSERSTFASQQICEDTQIIRTNQMHLDHSDEIGEYYAFINIQLKFNRNSLALFMRQFKPRRYRLLLYNLNDTYLDKFALCPSRQMLKEALQCFTLEHIDERISIGNHLSESNVTFACVLYMLRPQKVWPLHCVTFSLAIQCQQIPWILLVNLLWTVALVSIVSFLIGTFTVFMWTTFRLSNASGESNRDLGIDRNMDYESCEIESRDENRFNAYYASVYNLSNRMDSIEYVEVDIV